MPVPVRPFRFASVSVARVAVTTPVVAASIVFALATEGVSVRVIWMSVGRVTSADSSVNTLAVVPLKAVAPDASTVTLVTPSSVLRLVALAAPVTVRVKAPVLAPRSVARLAALAEATVAVTLPLVLPAIDAAALELIVSLTVTFSEVEKVILALSYMSIICAPVPLTEVAAVAVTVTVVLSARFLSASAETLVSVTVMVKALLPLASAMPARVARSPSDRVAVITPVVVPSRVACWEVLTDPLAVSATAAPVLMPVEPRAVLNSAPVPLMVAAEVASMATVVFASRFERSAAATEPTSLITRV